MQTFLIFALGGFIAQLVDGSLGMAYGVTSTTILLTAGLTPAVASASVHLAEIGTSAASGLSHWKFGNVDWRVVLILGVPGAVGAFLGATALSNLSTEAAEPWMSTILLVLGLYVLLRFALRPLRRKQLTGVSSKLLAPLGLVAGFVDATGGGGWGPVATPTLLSTGKVEPRKVVGSVDTSEFLIAVAASLGFIISLADEPLSWATVGALLIGGVIAAPLAAYLVRIVPMRLIGVGAGGLIVLTNARTLIKAFELPAPAVIYAVIVVAWVAALAFTVAQIVRDRREELPEEEASEPVGS
ncbi:MULTISPECIES: sulfite exporter TauE/SafE family protein [unclassified Saccharopolyspora]|uniref:sulfite exporter TauE/SafE family protein n=1 Tax=unclassified Saccharopolyspora TaxID=2646250 RepID=UPI001CD6E318|nr:MULTISPECIES: sulfite exporter TauE/SafE family protein [unclassified Saccharopolyspora]MCA1187263.1 sulfite exporter TauE/SafE family protein [Saccharopolyspora sp. 6T]MCA1193656.1 sulfite exporter TauE/SafE family protein [Saccharopolyspora sp. 6V]MCA1228163.1 sulfite exporter TauE/SafE family protein [Saccharopolyspora sp. 6M]MCA1282124.1 sulfite exporter TauE/SafE family protein [Saccharopolyspora sp. 7B]